MMLALLVGGIAPAAAADNLVQPDGRINQVAHFGGDALYCVDRDFIPTNQYSDFGQGGFRLLNMEGQELWFVPAAQISAAVAEAKETGKGVLVAEGYGSYGPVTIYTYVTDENDDYFVFSGYDEFGKPNSLTFKFCIPVGPIPGEPGEAGEDLCTVVLSKPFAGKVFGPVMGPAYPQQIPCEMCLNNPDSVFNQKRSTLYGVQIGYYCQEYSSN
jgi:hypothetical protein